MKMVDAIVIDGGISGCIAAKILREMGLETVVVEGREFLGHEITATGQTWIENGTLKSELPVLIGAVKKYLLAQQYDAGNSILFDAIPAMAAVNQNRCCGLVLGTPYGLMELSSRIVLDASANGILGALLGGTSTVSRNQQAKYRFEVENIEGYYENILTIPKEFQTLGNQILIHPQFKDHTVTIEFSYQLENHSPVLLAYHICSWLRNNISAFKSARLSALSSESLYRDAYYQIPEGWLGAIQVPVLEEYSNIYQLEKLEKQIRQTIQKLVHNLPESQKKVRLYKYLGGEISEEMWKYESYEDPHLSVPLKKVSIDYCKIVRRKKAEVVLAGFGTSGSAAAEALLEQGIKPVIVEQNRLPGGTSTVGYVSGFWHGYREGINRKRGQVISEISKAIAGTSNETNRMAGFIYIEEILRKYDCDPIYGSVVCGVIKSNNCITGVVIVDKFGIQCIDTDITIDATGNATVAYLAGLPYEYGDARDGSIQTYSQWGDEPWKVASFRESRYCMDFDAIYEEFYSEHLRGILLSHTRNSDQNFSEMLTVRESRRIIGEAVLNIRDIYGESIPEDCIAVTQTPIDTHGLSSNIFAEMGLSVCKEELYARIPYRCYLPKGVEGLLVTAKSFSGTRDAVCVCRMNADLRNAGYAVGLAAAKATKCHCALRKVNISEIQEILKEYGILPEWTFQRPVPIDWTMNGGSPEVIRAMLGAPQEALAKLEMAEKNPDTNHRLQEIVKAWFGDSEARGRCVKMVKQHPDDLACITILGLVHDRFSLEGLTFALSVVDTGGNILHKQEMYSKSRIDTWRIPNYQLIITLVNACSRAPSPSFCEKLEELMEKPEICGNISKNLTEVKPYLSAYLELKIGESLARCGSYKGVEKLIEFLEDVHPQFSHYSQTILTEILECNYGTDASKWKKVPYKQRIQGKTYPDKRSLQY